MIKSIVMFVVGLIIGSLGVFGYNFTRQTKSTAIKPVQVASNFITDLPIVQPSGKCGYQYFYKKGNGPYEEVVSNYMNIPNFMDSLLNGSGTPVQALVTVVVYTSGCPHGTSTPVYYFKGGSSHDAGSTDPSNTTIPISQIIKGNTFDEVKSYVFANPVAKVMSCYLKGSVDSVDELLKDRLIGYIPTTSFTPTDLTDEQKKRIISQGGVIKSIQASNQSHFDASTSKWSNMFDVYIEGFDSDSLEHYDCGDDMSVYTAFYESLDLPNVVVRGFRHYQAPPIWNDGGMVIVR